MKYLLYFPTAVLLFPLSALAQPVMVDMPWQIKSNTVLIVPLRKTTTGFAEIPNQAQPIDMSRPSVVIRFPGQSSSAMTVAGFRLKGTSVGSWIATWQADQALPSPTSVAAGNPLFIQFDHGALGGKLYWAPSLTALNALLPPPPAPAPPPVITPPPTTTASAIGDASPPLPQLIAADGATWLLTLPAGTVTRNGIDTHNPFGPAPQTLRIYVSPLNTIRVDSLDHGYNCWTGTGWSGSGC